MLKVKTVLQFTKFLLGAILVVGLAGPAFAGNVWSWRTEDGAFAFTDDSKRIPAKYRAEAQQRALGKLTRYERFTEVSTELDKSYAERIRERRSTLRGISATAPQGVVIGATATSFPEAVFGVPVTGGGNGGGRSGVSLLVPVGGSQTSSDSQLTTIESIRVKPRKSMATRHWTVVKKGDRIVTVIKGELNQQPLKARSESSFDL
jgi:hypothetical protein